MKLTLTEYIDSRCKELGITKQQMLDNADLDWNVLTNIRKGKSIRQETKQKLAKGLQCSIGDINAALANTPHSLRKEAEKPEGQAGIIITANKVTAKKDVADPEPEPEVDMMFPVETSEEPEETLEEFKARMKDMCLYEFSVCGNLEEAKILIAEAVLKELLGT